MELIHPEVQQYAEQYSSPEDDLLKKVGESSRLAHLLAIVLFVWQKD